MIQQDTREMIDHKEYKKNAKTDGTIENKDQVGRQTCQSQPQRGWSRS